VAAVAIAVAAVPVAGLLLVAGRPDSASGWLALAGPVLIGVAILLTEARIEAATIALGVALAGYLGPGTAALAASEQWSMIAGVAMYVGVCWVTCLLGLRRPLGPAVGWLALVIAAGLYGSGFDVPVVLGVAWWLVGRALRDRQQVTDRLRARAAELAAEQQRFAEEAVRWDRLRIARELHDVVAHCMTVIVIQARAGQRQVDSDAAAVPDTLEAIRSAAAESARDIETLTQLMAGQRRSLDTRMLASLVDRATRAGAGVRLTVHGDPDRLDPTWATVGYRAVQEALTNALRHAPGSDIEITVDCRDGLTLTVENEEPTPAGTTGPVTVGAGRGLLGLRERVTELGGQAAWGPTSGDGWRLQVALR
jgi:signal transduction histidine kinase